MHVTRNNARQIAILSVVCAAAATLTGCHSSSKTTLGFRPNQVVQDRYAVTDSIGAAMFAQQVRLAHAEAYNRHLERTEFATVPIED